MNHGDPRQPDPRPDEAAEPSPWTTTTWSDAAPSATPSERPPRAETVSDGDPFWTQASWSGSAAQQTTPSTDPAPSQTTSRAEPASDHAPFEEPRTGKPAVPPRDLPDSSEPTIGLQDDLADLHLPRRTLRARGFPQPIPGPALTTLFVALLSVLLVIASLVWPA